MRARALPLARELVDRGHDVTLLLPPWDNPADSGKRWADGGVSVVNIALPRRFQLSGITHRLYRALDSLAPDIVHLFKPKGYAALAAAGLSRRLPLLLDTDDWEGRGGWNDRGRYTIAQRFVFDWQERTLPRLARNVTVATRTLETQMWGLGVAPGRVVYLPNGLSFEHERDWPADPAVVEEQRAALGLAGSPTVLLYTRFVEFSPRRAVDIFLEVRKRVPDARLLIAGSGLRGEEREMAAELERHELGPAAAWIPWVPAHELAATLAVGDVAMLPYDDTLINRAKCSVKTLDLMAAAVPVVAEAVGQNADYFVHNESGLLIAPGDNSAFAGAIADLLADPERRARFGGAARQRALRVFAWSRLADQVERLYDSALDGGR